MHTSELNLAELTVEIDGASVDADALWPGWSRHDRLGVVVREPAGAIGASLLVLSAMSRFYADVRARGATLPRFADHYLFHVGRRLGDHKVDAVVRDSLAHGGPSAQHAAARRAALREAGRPLETYRRVPPAEALSALVV